MCSSFRRCSACLVRSEGLSGEGNIRVGGDGALMVGWGHGVWYFLLLCYLLVSNLLHILQRPRELRDP